MHENAFVFCATGGANAASVDDLPLGTIGRIRTMNGCKQVKPQALMNDSSWPAGETAKSEKPASRIILTVLSVSPTLMRWSR